MLLLAIDTADKSTGVALFKDNKIIACETQGFSKECDTALATLTQKLFEDTGLVFEDLSALALSAGPGSFTGLRVGCAYAKGICLALKLPLLAVDSLTALAYSVNLVDRLLVPFISAKGNEVYYAFFRRSQGKVERIGDNRLLDLNQLKAQIPSTAYIFSSLDLNEAELPVKSVALLGAQLFADKQIVDIKTFEPKYLQEFKPNF